jgi:hypothetical protein
MSVDTILASIDREIAQLERARSLLSGLSTKTKTPKAAAPKKKRRKMSAEARKRIADSQRKRWAKQKAGKA